MSDFNILLSSAGRRVALLRILRQSLTDMGLSGKVFAADMVRLSSAFHLADGGVIVPRCTSQEFIPEVLGFCRKHGVKLVVPTIDTELAVYAQHRANFEREGVTVAVSSPDVIAIGSDKQLTHEWLMSCNLPTVSQRAAEDVLRAPEDWQFPCILKPRGGSSSIGVARVADVDQLRTAMGRADDIVQTIAPGHEYTVDFLADLQGRCLCTVPRRRIEVRGGEVSKGLTVRSAALQGLAKRVCETLPGAYAALCVQIFFDESTGEQNIIEINPRFGGGFPLSWQAGAHFPRWIIEEVLGCPSTAEADCWQNHLLMLRFDDALFLDANAAGLG